MKVSSLTRWDGLAGIVAGLSYFVGYAGMAELLVPVISNPGGHVVLGLAGLATLPALVGVLARYANQSDRLGRAGYALSFVGAGVFSAGNLAEGVFAIEFGIVLFRVGLMILTMGVVVLGLGLRRAKVLPARAAWPLVVGWAAFLPVANSTVIFDFAFLVLSSLGAGWVAVGYALWTDGSSAIREGEVTRTCRSRSSTLYRDRLSGAGGRWWSPRGSVGYMVSPSIWGYGRVPFRRGRLCSGEFLSSSPWSASR